MNRYFELPKIWRDYVKKVSITIASHWVSKKKSGLINVRTMFWINFHIVQKRCAPFLQFSNVLGRFLLVRKLNLCT